MNIFVSKEIFNGKGFYLRFFWLNIWNHFKNCDSRVNNNNEGYNHRFSRRSGCVPHPNIWAFVEVTQREEFVLVQVRYARILSGAIKSNGRRKEDLIRDNVLLKAKNKFLQSSKNIADAMDLLQTTTCATQNFIE